MCCFSSYGIFFDGRCTSGLGKKYSLPLMHFITTTYIFLRAVDQHSLNADPDPAVFLNADPDPDPGPGLA